MISMIEKHKRILIALGLLIMLLCSGVTLLEFNIEFSGATFVIVALSIFLYLPISWLLTRRKGVDYIEWWQERETWGVFLFIGLLCLIGAIESYHHYLIFTIIFIEVLFLLIFFLYGLSKTDDFAFPKWTYWLFFIGNGLLIIVAEDFFIDKEQFGIALLFYFTFLFLMITRWFFQQTKSILKLKNEQTKTELMHLQSQVNPHFFFNMLNNLYGWVEKDSKKAQELILQLSDMMRYSIYDGQKEVVALEEEIEYLKNYIELHKMRYHKKIKVVFDIDMEEERYEVMPLLFIILLENAFKHGVEMLREDAFINIALFGRDQEIHFSVENNFDPEASLASEGIGLKNLKRRLELVYPKKHSLSLNTMQNIYKAKLIINLK